MKRSSSIKIIIQAAVLISFLLHPLHVLSSETWYLNTPSGYQRMGGESRLGPYSSEEECNTVNIQYFNRAGSCSCSSTSDSISSGSQGGGEDWGEVLRQKEEARRRQEEERRRRELERQKKEAEEEAERRETEAKEKFERSKQEAMQLMKGTGADSLEIKSGTDFFSTDGDLKIKSGTITEGASNKAAEIWACATWIADYLFPAARKGDADEIEYLEGQVSKSLSGETPGVECPDISSSPAVQGVAIGLDSPGNKFYSALIKEISAQSKNIIKAKKEIAEALGKKNVTDEDIRKLEEEQKDREKIKTAAPDKDKIEDNKEKEKPKEEMTSPAPETDKEVEDSIAQALAALKRAQEAKNKIDECESMHKKVQTDPTQAEKLTNMIGK